MHTRGKPLAEGVRLADVARQTSGLTGADLANICNEAAISAGRSERDEIVQADFDYAVERVVAGLQHRKLITGKEKRVIAYHEAGHALVARLMGDAMQLHKVTIVPRGQALGYMLNLPEEDRYLQSTEELRDWLKVILAGRAAEQVVFGRITNGAENDLERATAIARSMVFEWGMGESMPHQQLRADNYGLSEKTKRCATREQRGITDAAYREALRLVSSTASTSTASHRRCWRQRRWTARRSTYCSTGSSPYRTPRATSASSSRPGDRAAAAPDRTARRRARRWAAASAAGVSGTSSAEPSTVSAPGRHPSGPHS